MIERRQPALSRYSVCSRSELKLLVDDDALAFLVGPIDRRELERRWPGNKD